jgi:hypothetical protein
MAQLADMLAQVRANEILQAEAEIASCFPQPPKVTPEAQDRLAPFLAWCEQQKVRSLPARPTSVAAYAQYQQDQGIPREKINATLSAIEAMHVAASVGNPVATPVVRTVTGGSTIEAPRSWDKDGRAAWAQLPPDVQSVIAARESDRERTLRRGQNELAEMKKLLRLQAAAETKTADNTKENTMAKKEGYEKGVGPYSKNDVKLNRQNNNSWATKDISKVVDEAWKIDDGFAGKLPNND